MNYADIRPIDVANGPGIRVSLFVSGCTHACPGCFNPEAWDFGYGQPFTKDEVDAILTHLAKPYVKGLSLLGGEPFHPSNQAAVLELVKRVREAYPGKDIWCYTGYLYEDLLSGKVDQKIAHAEYRITRLVSDTHFDHGAVLFRNDAVQSQRQCHPLVLLDTAVIVGIQHREIRVFIQRVLL